MIAPASRSRKSSSAKSENSCRQRQKTDLTKLLETFIYQYLRPCFAFTNALSVDLPAIDK
jgi:hypothetical protein